MTCGQYVCLAPVMQMEGVEIDRALAGAANAVRLGHDAFYLSMTFTQGQSCSPLMLSVATLILWHAIKISVPCQVMELIEELNAAGSEALGVTPDAGAVPRLLAYARSVAGFPQRSRRCALPWRRPHPRVVTIAAVDNEPAKHAAFSGVDAGRNTSAGRCQRPETVSSAQYPPSSLRSIVSAVRVAEWLVLWAQHSRSGSREAGLMPTAHRDAEGAGDGLVILLTDRRARFLGKHEVSHRHTRSHVSRRRLRDRCYADRMYCSSSTHSSGGC